MRGNRRLASARLGTECSDLPRSHGRLMFEHCLWAQDKIPPEPVTDTLRVESIISGQRAKVLFARALFLCREAGMPSSGSLPFSFRSSESGAEVLQNQRKRDQKRRESREASFLPVTFCGHHTLRGGWGAGDRCRGETSSPCLGAPVWWAGPWMAPHPFASHVCKLPGIWPQITS